jgi:hypothetical protein
LFILFPKCRQDRDDLGYFLKTELHKCEKALRTKSNDSIFALRAACYYCYFRWLLLEDNKGEMELLQKEVSGIEIFKLGLTEALAELRERALRTNRLPIDLKRNYLPNFAVVSNKNNITLASTSKQPPSSTKVIKPVQNKDSEGAVNLPNDSEIKEKVDEAHRIKELEEILLNDPNSASRWIEYIDIKLSGNLDVSGAREIILRAAQNVKGDEVEDQYSILVENK